MATMRDFGDCWSRDLIGWGWQGNAGGLFGALRPNAKRDGADVASKSPCTSSTTKTEKRSMSVRRAGAASDSSSSCAYVRAGSANSFSRVWQLV